MIQPTPKQTAFLLTPHKEVLYGGAAGGGKSIGILAAASQYLDVPGYSALILRQSYLDLALPDALMDVSQQWWKGKGPNWNSTKYVWTFPSGATVTFGYLEREADKYRYQGAQFQFIGFDELTQFETETRYLYLFSRLRRLEGFPVPLRVRAATNPGGIGHEWVKRRFISERHPQRIFIPANLEDNPYLDQSEYEESLAVLDPATRLQLRAGDWDIDPRGGMFKRDWFKILPDASHLPPNFMAEVRYWDLAATVEEEARDPDYTVGTRMGMTEGGHYVISDVIRVRKTPEKVEELIRDTAQRDGPNVPIFMAQDPGQAGKAQISHYRRKVLPGYFFYADKDYRSTSKEIRAKPFSSDAEAGNVSILLGTWLTPWLDEHVIFNEGAHDDQVDSSVGAHAMLNKWLRNEQHKKARQQYSRNRRHRQRERTRR